jgi:hypothetical protein
VRRRVGVPSPELDTWGNEPAPYAFVAPGFPGAGAVAIPSSDGPLWVAESMGTFLELCLDQDQQRLPAPSTPPPRGR